MCIYGHQTCSLALTSFLWVQAPEYLSCDCPHHLDSENRSRLQATASPSMVTTAQAYVHSASTAAAGQINYDLLHGRSERGGDGSTALPAALRMVEALTRPITAAEALNSPAVAHGLAAEQFEDEEDEQTHDEVKRNSGGNLRAVDIGGMDSEYLKSMHSKIVDTLVARGEASVMWMMGILNQTAELENTVGNKAMKRDANTERTADMTSFPTQGHLPGDGRLVGQQTAQVYCTETITPVAATPDMRKNTEGMSKDALEQHQNIGRNPNALPSTPVQHTSKATAEKANSEVDLTTLPARGWDPRAGWVASQHAEQTIGKGADRQLTTSPTTKETITQLTEEGSKHKAAIC